MTNQIENAQNNNKLNLHTGFKKEITRLMIINLRKKMAFVLAVQPFQLLFPLCLH